MNLMNQFEIKPYNSPLILKPLNNLSGLRSHIISLLVLLLLPAVSSFSQTDVAFWFVAPEITIGHGDYPGGEPVYFRLAERYPIRGEP